MIATETWDPATECGHIDPRDGLCKNPPTSSDGYCAEHDTHQKRKRSGLSDGDLENEELGRQDLKLIASAPIHAEPPTPELRFVPATELAAQAPPEPAWVWTDYIAAGTVTLLAGKPKCGKSTLTCALIEAVVSGATSFLGRDVDSGPVVLAAQESTGTLLPKLPRYENLLVLTRDGAWPKPSWSQLIAAAVKEAERVGAVMLVIDTFSFWSGLKAEGEKDAGATQRALDALHEATTKGIAVLLDHHARKGGGEDGEAVRGSNAITGAVDVVLELERVEKAPPGQRRVVALSRWPQTPDALVVDREPVHGGWSVVGESADRGATAWLSRRKQITEKLQSNPGATTRELGALLGEQNRGDGLSSDLRRGVEEGWITRTAKGVRSDPYHHWLTPDSTAQTTAKKLCADSVQGFRTETHRNGDTGHSSFCATRIGIAQKEKESAVGNAWDDFPPHRNAQERRPADSVDTPTITPTLADLSDAELADSAGEGSTVDGANVEGGGDE